MILNTSGFCVGLEKYPKVESHANSKQMTYS